MYWGKSLKKRGFFQEYFLERVWQEGQLQSNCVEQWSLHVVALACLSQLLSGLFSSL